MIFKQLFKPKWKHPNESTRLGALSQLDNQQHHAILQQLASQDPSSKVRSAALKKLNDIDLWWQACQSDAEPGIKRLANQKVAEVLMHSPQALSSADKERYLERFANEKTLEQLALAEKTTATKVKLIHRLNKPQLTEQVFRGADEALQLQLCQLVINAQLADKLVKHAQGEAKTRLAQAIEEQQLAAHMPQQVAQQSKLLLAQLNALRDKNDYQLVTTQYTQFSHQFAQLETHWLDEELRTQNDEKFAVLKNKLERHIAILGEQYERQQAQQQAQQRSVLALANLSALAEEISNAMALRFDGNEQIQTDWLHAKVAQAEDMLQSPDLQPGAELTSQRQELKRLFKQVEQLSAYEQDVEQLRERLKEYQAMAVAETSAQLDAALTRETELAKEIQQSLSALPKELAGVWRQSYQQAKKAWFAQMQPLLDAQQQTLNQARKKTKDLRRLINQGRYRVAFGVFNGLDTLYQELTEHYRQQVSREYESLKTTLSEAEDWHQYAGQSQQTQLLEAALELAQSPCEDANERLAAVKKLRKSWQLLGPHVEAQAKQEFEQQIETAFAPCRDYFAEQQAQKEQAVAEREALVAQMQTLDAQAQQADHDIVSLEAQFNQLLKQWRGAKRLESKLYHKLNKAFNEAQTAIAERVQDYYQHNASAKEDLLEQAHQAQQQDVFAATHTLKDLQQQWQQVGFAGKSKERKLWLAFRRINDAVFAQRDEAKEQRQQVHNDLLNEQQTQLAQLQQQLSACKEAGDYQEVVHTVSALNVERPLQDMKKQLLAQAQQSLHTLQAAQRHAHYRQLRSALSQGQALDKRWLSDSKLALAAEQLLVRLEVTANIDSPSSDASLRMQEQVTMLDEKHQGVAYSLDDLLIAWLNAVGVNEQHQCLGEQQQLNRIVSVLEAVESQ